VGAGPAACPEARRAPSETARSAAYLATLALQAGKSVRWVADQLGHADPALTLRVYAHSLPTEGGDLAFADFETAVERAENGSERLYPALTEDGEDSELRNLAKSLARPARLELATSRFARCQDP